MRKTLGYLHEVWLCPDEFGNALPACIAHGPDGDAARALNEPGSDWIWTFWHRHLLRRCVFITNSSAMGSTHPNPTTISFHIRKIGMSARSRI